MANTSRTTGSVATATAAAPRWRGLDYGPAIVVLVPVWAGPAEPPAAWRTAEQHYQLAWCEVPADTEDSAALHRVEDVLETLADRGTRTQIVAHTALVEVAAALIAEFPQIVRGLVLVGSGRVTAPTGVRTRRVAGADLSDPEVVREVVSAVEPGEAATARLSLPTEDRIELSGLRVRAGRS